MNRTLQLLLGVALIAAGLVFALDFPDLHFPVFTGRPLGIVLVVLGVLDLAEAAFSRRDRPT